MPNSPVDKFWWQLPRDKTPDIPKTSGERTVHNMLFPHVRSIEENQIEISQLNMLNAKLYSNRELQGIQWGTHFTRNARYRPATMISENIVSSVINTVTALIGKNWVKPTPVVKDADFAIQRTAEQLDRYLYGELRRLDAWPKLQRMFNDACWAQIGAVRIDIDPGENEIFMERVNPDEIIVDQRECVSECNPVQMHYRRVVNREVLRNKFPDFESQIRDAQGLDFRWTSFRTPGNESLVVVESWKLPSPLHPEGRHVIAIENATLLDEDYKRKVFPFIFFRWEELPSGFYGKPLAEDIAPFQLRMNEINRVIQRAQDLMSVPRIFVDQGSKMVKEQIDNEVGRVLLYRGKPPVVMNWTAMTPEIYAERERQRSAAFEYAGVSQLSAQAKLPANVRLDSSKALREFSVRENERFAVQSTRYERLIIELANHILRLSAILFKNGTDKAVSFVDRSLVQEIEWSQVKDMVENKLYVFQIESSSLVNMTPAARQDTLNQWVNQGVISFEEHRALLKHPDLEDTLSLNAAGINNIKSTIRKLDASEFATPDPLQDLETGIRMVQLAYLDRLDRDAPEEILENFRDWIAAAQELINQQTEVANAQQQQAILAQGIDPNTGQPIGLDPAAQINPEGVTPQVATTSQGSPITGLA